MGELHPMSPTTTPCDPLGLDSATFLHATRAAGLPQRQSALPLWQQAQRSGTVDWSLLPTSARPAWQAQLHPSRLQLAERIDEAGPQGSTSKLILTTADDQRIETVVFPVGRRRVVCISSQIGCRLACRFCETGRMGLRRNLTPGEIIAQVAAAAAAIGRAPERVVFMGMGEALDNADAVIASLHILTDRRGWAYAHDRLTVCTAGHAAGIRRLATLGWSRLNLSISLNAADDALRDQLMPINRRTRLAELQELLIAYRPRRNFQLGVNYCLLPGINDRPGDAAAIAAFCAPLGRVMVHLIPYNPGRRPLTRAPTAEEITTFVASLRAAGLPVRSRVVKGRDIRAACGQLGEPKDAI